MAVLCAAALILRQHAADLVSVSPSVLPTDGSTPTLHLMGGGAGGLLAGSAYAGNSSLPPNKHLCCDYNGLCNCPIGGDTRATLLSATTGTCVVPKFAAAGPTRVKLYLSDRADCQGDCHGGGSERVCDHGLGGQADFDIVSRASILTFAPGRRPYVSEESGALVVKAADEKDIAIWFPNGTGPVHLHVTATLALPSGPRQLFAAPQAVKPGQSAALPFDFTGLPSRVEAVVTAVVTVKSIRTGSVLMTTNSSRLFQRFQPGPSGPPGGVVQLDRHRRALLVDGGVYLGSGWYVEGGDFIRNFTTAIDRMSQHGYNMVMTYRFRKAVVADTAEVVPTPAELAAFLKHCESVGMFVIFDFM